MKNKLEEGVEILTAVYIKSFDVKEELKGEDLSNLPDIPKHFIKGGVYIAIKHMHKDGDLYRVFFNKITGKTTKKSFFKESMEMSVAGLLIDLNDGDVWEIEMEEFNFLKTEDYKVSEKALATISELILMPISEFKEKTGETEGGISVDKVSLNGEVIEDTAQMENLSKDDQRLIALDAAMSSLQDYIIGTIGEKYDESDIDSKDLIFSKDHGKSINVFNATKYLARYLNEEGEKANNVIDLLKASHYIMFEVARRVILKNKK